MYQTSQSARYPTHKTHWRARQAKQGRGEGTRSKNKQTKKFREKIISEKNSTHQRERKSRENWGHKEAKHAIFMCTCISIHIYEICSTDIHVTKYLNLIIHKIYDLCEPKLISFGTKYIYIGENIYICTMNVHACIR